MSRNPFGIVQVLLFPDQNTCTQLGSQYMKLHFQGKTDPIHNEWGSYSLKYRNNSLLGSFYKWFNQIYLSRNPLDKLRAEEREMDRHYQQDTKYRK